jgi:para-nitrobenzyl esterase
MLRREFLRAGGLVLSASVVTGLAGCSDGAAVRPSPVLSLQSGQVQGQVVDGVHRFLGIPYAETPFAENRFRAPAARAPWQGIFPADSYGFACPQLGLVQPGTPKVGKDCLNLNVWTLDPSAGGLPVMVWAHAGDQSTGAGSLPVYDGSHFAVNGVVLETCNRRLGAEGFLYLEELMGDGIGPGNLGVLDQIEVLRWVQENIHQFGGDANNVTLFGQSAGGAVVQAVVASPASVGLVHKVIPQNASHGAQRPESAKEIARYVLQRVGVKAGDLSALKDKPWADFAGLDKDIDALGLGQPQAYLPVLSEAMPVHPADAAHSGFGLQLDYLLGTCTDERAPFMTLSGNVKSSPFFARVERVLALTGASWTDLVTAYRSFHPDLDKSAIDQFIVDDLSSGAANMRIAEGHALRSSGRTYTFRYDLMSGLGRNAHALDRVPHGLDLMMFSNGNAQTADLDSTAIEQTADFVRRSWVNFAKTGDPSSAACAWPEYDTEFRRTVAINEAPSILHDPFAFQRKLLGKVMTDNWQLMGL